MRPVHWFEVDKAGLAALLARRGKAFVVYELLQNAWDEGARLTCVTLTSAGRGKARLRVEDDCAEGFRRLSDAYTLFAPSEKKAHVEQRGRFNLGEKLVLALCTEAHLSTTSGQIDFTARGRELSRARRLQGSEFTGIFPASTEDLDDIERAIFRMIPPAEGVTTFNGSRLTRPSPVATITHPLATELADAEGRLRRTERRTRLDFYRPNEGESAWLYEMGVPVVETGDAFSVDVAQKVPLNMERDNVTAAYLARVRAYCLEATASELTSESANATWVKDAISTHAEKLPDAALTRVFDQRFGRKAVAFDPSDLEANHRAVEEGFTVVHGGQLSRAEWAAARRVGALPAAGQVTPTPKPFTPGGKPLVLVPQSDWSAAMIEVAALAQRLGAELLACDIDVRITRTPQWPVEACFGHQQLTFNLGRLGERWPNGPLSHITELLIHEFAHHFEADHLSKHYHDTLCRLGAQMTCLALNQPELFARSSATKRVEYVDIPAFLRPARHA